MKNKSWFFLIFTGNLVQTSTVLGLPFLFVYLTKLEFKFHPIIVIYFIPFFIAWIALYQIRKAKRGWIYYIFFLGIINSILSILGIHDLINSNLVTYSVINSVTTVTILLTISFSVPGITYLLGCWILCRKPKDRSDENNVSSS